MMMPALREYRARFEPSAQLDKPYAMVGVNVFAADSDGEAQRMFTSLQQQFNIAYTQCMTADGEDVQTPAPRRVVLAPPPPVVYAPVAVYPASPPPVVFVPRPGF